LPEAVVGVLEDVTARRHAEAALEQRAEMLDNVTDAVILSDEAFNVLYWNRGAEVLYGWSASETIGRPAGDFVQLDVDADRLEEILASFRREGMWRGELPHRLRDGRSIPVESQTVARQLRDGTRYVVSVNRDVSERAAVAAALARRTEQQEAVASLALAALADSDLDAVLAAGTKLVAETLEIPLCGVLELAPDGQELLLRSGVGWRDGVIGHHRVAVRDTSLAAYTLTADEAVIVDDLEHERRFTPPPFLLDHGIVGGAAVVVYGARHPYGVLEALTTERRTFSQDDVRFLRGVAAIVGLAIERARADAALQQAETRYRGLVERGPGVVYLHDTATAPAAVTYVSPQVEAFLGYPRSAWTDDPRFWIDVLHPDDRERIVRADTRAIEAGEDLDLEYRVIASDGREVWVHDHATVITDRAGAPLFRQGLLVDVTDRRRAEDERRAALEQQVRLATRLELLHEVDREIRGATTIVDLCQRTLERLRSLLRADFASIGILDARRGTIDFPAMIHDEEMVVLPASPDVTDAEALELMSREVLRVDDVDDLGSTSAYVGTVRQQGLRSVLSFALYSAGEHVGVLIVGSRAPSAFGEEAEDVGREVASILAIAIRQQRLRDALAERAAELEQLAVERQQMLRRIVRAQEEERERVALELHDGLGQILTSVSLFASDLEDEVPEASRPRASRVNELVRRAIADSRQLVWSLRPPELERLGLVPALRRLAEDSSSADLTVDLHERIGDLRLGPDEEAVVYRVVQEAVHNARKHADASAISILLQQRDGVVSTIVEDNGHGFEPDRVPPGRGLGLIGMRERAELVDGGVVVESAAGAGTRVRLEVPVSASVPG
jgi:PAS domain S-box-containing protein